jgi:hypothetical protein
VGNVLTVPLEAKPGVVDMRAPKLAHTYTFDGIVPGSTWESAAGGQLQGIDHHGAASGRTSLDPLTVFSARRQCALTA